MAKELPYYKFEVMSFMTGDIYLERYELQGIFYNLCAFYWSKDCDLKIAAVMKKYPHHFELIKELIELDIIKVDGEYLSISFLNEQWASKETQKMVNAINGKKGGRPKREDKPIETENKPNGLNFVNPNETNIEKSKVEKIIEEESKENDFAFTEKKSELINLICEKYGYHEMRFANKQKVVMAYVNLHVKNEDDYDFLIENIQSYSLYKQLSEEKQHGFDGLYGTQQEQFKDGALQKENWKQKLLNHQLYEKPKSQYQKTNNVFDQYNELKKKQRNGNTEV